MNDIKNKQTINKNTVAPTIALEENNVNAPD